MKPKAPENRAPAGATDFNDLHQTGGLDAVRLSVEAAIKAPPPAPAAPEAGADDWPAPQSLGHELTAHEPYPLDALPPILRGAVEEVLGFVKCPESLAACSALSHLSLAVQGLVDVRRDPGLEGPVSLFFMAIADSGERKSQCDSYFSAPQNEWETRQRIAGAPKQKDWKAAKDAWEQSKNGLRAAIKATAQKGRDTGSLAEKLRELEQEEPEEPMTPNTRHTNVTPEGIAWALQRWPSAGFMTSEGGSVFGGHGMSGDSLMSSLSMMNLAWDGARTTLTRRSLENSLNMVGRRMTFGISVQAATLEAFFEKTGGLARGTGFMARFLVACQKSNQGFRPYSPPPLGWPRLTAFQHRMKELLELPLPMKERGELNPTMLELSPDAKAAWITTYNAIEIELRPGGDFELIRDVASKAADNVVRLAALLHVLEHGPDGIVGLSAMNNATSIVAWHLTEARRYFGEHSLPKLMLQAQRLDDWLVGWCRENGTDSIPTRELQRLGPNCLRNRDTLDKVLAELLDANRARIVTEGKQKRVAVNPALLREG